MQGKHLEIFSEQTSETVHKNIDKTWKRFSVSNRNSGHGEKVRKMAVTYSSMRVYYVKLMNPYSSIQLFDLIFCLNYVPFQIMP